MVREMEMNFHANGHSAIPAFGTLLLTLISPVLNPLIQAVKDASGDDVYCKAVSALTAQLGGTHPISALVHRKPRFIPFEYILTKSLVRVAATRYDAAKLIAETTLKTLSSKPSEARAIWACHLIHSLSYSCEKSKTLIGKDLAGIPVLLKCLTLASLEARQQCAAALTSLVSGVQKCRSIFQSNNGVELTWTSFREVPPSAKAKADLLLLLCAVSRTGAMAKQLVDLKTLPVFIDLAKSSDTSFQIRDSAANVIAGIAANSSLLPALLEVDILNFCASLLKTDPLPEHDAKDTPILADRPLEILAHLSLEPESPPIDVAYAILISKRARQLSSRDGTSLSKADKVLYQLLNNSTHHFRQNELYRMKMETADPDAMLATKPASPTKYSSQIAKLVNSLADTDVAKASEAARKLAELMTSEGVAFKKEVLAQDDVFAKLWKFVRQGKLGWEDKWYATIDPAKLKFKEELGVGAFATVYRGTLKLKGRKEPVAIKALDEALIDLPDFRCELATLSLLSGIVDNMVQFSGYFYLSQKNSGVMKQVKHYHCIVMELMETNLEEILHDPKKQLPLKVPEVRRIAFDMAYGMYQLHSYGVLHRDLKPANILLNKRKDPLPWQVKLADFGYARRDSKESLRKSVVGTPAYLAPELIGHTKSDDVGMPADVYSYGVILWEMLSRKKPHDGMESAGMFHHVITCVEKKSPIFMAPPDCDAAIGEIMQACTHSDPKKRPTFATIHAQLTALLKATGQ